MKTEKRIRISKTKRQKCPAELFSYSSKQTQEWKNLKSEPLISKSSVKTNTKNGLSKLPSLTNKSWIVYLAFLAASQTYIPHVYTVSKPLSGLLAPGINTSGYSSGTWLVDKTRTKNRWKNKTKANERVMCSANSEKRSGLGRQSYSPSLLLSSGTGGQRGKDYRSVQDLHRDLFLIIKIAAGLSGKTINFCNHRINSVFFPPTINLIYSRKQLLDHRNHLHYFRTFNRSWELTEYFFLICHLLSILSIIRFC